MEAQRTILVVGATGKQGRSTIKYLLNPDQQAPQGIKFKVLALTRDTSSPSARQLLERNKKHASSINLVQGDLEKPESIRKIFQDAASPDGHGIWGVFVALAYPGLGESAAGEIRQGKVRLLLTIYITRPIRVEIYSCSCWPILPSSSVLRCSCTRVRSRLAPQRMTISIILTVQSRKLRTIARNLVHKD